MKRNEVEVLQGNCLEVMPSIAENSFQCCVTSPPYWNLRDYGTEPVPWPEVSFVPVVGLPEIVIPKQKVSLGLEKDPWAYVGHLLLVFREVRRVLRKDGTLWLNLGDSYVGASRTSGRLEGLPAKNMLGMPWRVAFALQADGWYLRMDNVWEKPAGLPESVKDRPTKSHEYVFLLSKSARYYYDEVAVREPYKTSAENYERARKGIRQVRSEEFRNASFDVHRGFNSPRDGLGKNRRSVWTIPNMRFPDAHFAVMPPALVRVCLKAGTSQKGRCSKCGKPWNRMVEKEPDNTGYSNGPGGKKRHFDVVLGEGGSSTLSEVARYNVVTVGWEPGCKCGVPETHCAVMDPFGGSGTVGLVAEEMGLDATLIELSGKYVEMAGTRIGEKRRMANLISLIPETARS